MANQTLTLTYNTTGRRRVTQSGLTSPMGDAMRRFLSRWGIHFDRGAAVGYLNDPAAFTVGRRGSLVAAFNAAYDQDPNPQHATDNFTLTLTAA